MQIGDYLCYFLLLITLTAVNARELRPRRGLSHLKPKRILKRDAAILIDNFPIEPSYSNHNTKVIYRRLSRHGPPKHSQKKYKYGVPKSKYGPSKYGPPKYRPPAYGPPKAKKAPKKYRKPVNAQHLPPKPKRSPKPRYGPPKRPSTRPPYYTSEPTGFAEPPTEIDLGHKIHQNYAEPPTDSYGAPLQKPSDDIYPTAIGYNNQQFDNDFTDLGREYQESWQNVRDGPNIDNAYAYTHNKPVYSRPDEVFDNLRQQDQQFNFDSYSDLNLNRNRKKPHVYLDNHNRAKFTWKAPKSRPDRKPEYEDGVLVGGQYAEPPARYVPKFQPSAPMTDGDDEFLPPKAFDDTIVAASATSAAISPYVNYKNSNMAFSPQNLNDAFSIVYK